MGRVTRVVRGWVVVVAAAVGPQLVLGTSPAHGQDLSGPALMVGGFGAGLIWDDEVEGRTDILLGARAGMDLWGVGVRGFYARAAEAETGFGTLEGMGLELEGRLARTRLLSPVLVGGVSRFDYRDGRAPALRPAFRSVHVGGGIRAAVTDRLGLELLLRDHLTTVDGSEPWEAPSFGDLQHHLAFSGGLALHLGGRTPGEAQPPVPVPPVPVPAAPPASLLDPEAAVVDTDRAREIGFFAGGDTVVVLPLPREGELYVRYGPGQSRVSAPVESELDPETVRRLIREEITALLPLLMLGAQQAQQPQAAVPAAPAAPLPAAPAAPAAPAVTEAQLRELEARIVGRVDDLLTRRVREESDLLRRTLLAEILPEIRTRAPVAVTPLDPFRPVEVAPAAPRTADPVQLTLYTGLAVPSPYQGLFGLKADVARVLPRVRELRFVPEVALGFGDGGFTLMALPNLVFEAAEFVVAGTRVRPHGGVGLGVLVQRGDLYLGEGTEGILNLKYGATMEVHPRHFPTLGVGTRLLLEHQGLDLYRTHRILFGLQRRF